MSSRSADKYFKIKADNCLFCSKGHIQNSVLLTLRMAIFLRGII